MNRWAYEGATVAAIHTIWQINTFHVPRENMGKRVSSPLEGRESLCVELSFELLDLLVEIGPLTEGMFELF